MQLELSSIRKDGGTQPRATYHFGVADSYAEDMAAGAVFPPIVVFYDGSDYWLADGFHRVFAAEKIGNEAIDADVRQGTLADAQWYSYSVNQSHGLRRSNDDKRRAVEAALKHPKAAGMSDGDIADHCGVTREYVNRMRGDLVNKSQDTPRTVTRNGKTYTQNTANIGKAKQPPKPAQPVEVEPEDDDTDDLAPANTAAPSPAYIDPDEVYDTKIAGFSVGVRRLCRELGDELPEEVFQRMIDVYGSAIADRV